MCLKISFLNVFPSNPKPGPLNSDSITDRGTVRGMGGELNVSDPEGQGPVTVTSTNLNENMMFIPLILITKKYKIKIKDVIKQRRKEKLTLAIYGRGSESRNLGCLHRKWSKMGE